MLPKKELQKAIQAGITKINTDTDLRLAFLASIRKTLKTNPKILDPRKIPSAFIKKASTIRGAFKFGRLVDDLSGYSIDLKLLGSVAVWKDGARVGKGGGYSDLEYAILRENGWISEITPLVTTVHDLQLYKEIPMCEHDVPIDYIITPSKIIKTELKYKKPKGIYWDILTQEKLSSIPLLQRLWKQDNALMRKENHFL